jgi:hypothetical protein
MLEMVVREVGFLSKYGTVILRPGLSLRNPSEMLSCINTATNYDPANENEDLFFVKCLSKARKNIAPLR